MKRFHVRLAAALLAHRAWWEIRYGYRWLQRWDGACPLPRTPSPRELVTRPPVQAAAEAILVGIAEAVIVRWGWSLTALAVWLAFGPEGWAFAAPGLALGALGGLAVTSIMSAERSVIVIVHPYVKCRLLRKRVQRRWPLAMHNARCFRPDANGEPKARSMPTVRRVRATPYGVTATVDGSVIGADAETLAGHRRVILSTVRARDLKAVDVRPGTVRVELRIRDPLATVVRFPELAQPDDGLKVATGRDDDGMELVRDARLPGLVVGAQGAGKSSEGWVLLHALQERGVPVRARIFDPKRQEWAPFAGDRHWDGQAWSNLGQAAYQYEDDPRAWPDFIGKACGGLAARQIDLAQRGVKELTTFTPLDPLDLLIVDELLMAKLFGKEDTTFRVGGKKITMPATDAFTWYLSQARAAGGTCYAATQIGTKDIVGPLRPLFTYMTCLRVGQAEDSMVDAVLGGGASKRYPAHQLPADRRSAGIGWTITDFGVVKYRAAYLTDLERRMTVKRTQRDTEAIRAARRGYGTEEASA